MEANHLSEPLKILTDNSSNMSEITRALNELDKNEIEILTQKWGVISNITLNVLETYLRKYGYLSNVKIDVSPGTYDNYFSDINEHKSRGVENVVLISFFDNIQPSFEAQIPTLNNQQVNDIKNKYFDQLSVVLDSAKDLKKLFISDFNRYTPNTVKIKNESIDNVIDNFNRELIELCSAYPNTHIISSELIIRELGRKETFDDRFYYQGKAPFSAAAQEQIAKIIFIASRKFETEFAKAVILDCDGTLWGGIIGEDGLDGIKLDPYDFPGNIYWRAQQIILDIASKGALICLCSKNEELDVDNVLFNHPNMLLKHDMISAKKVNWQDKAQNINEIANELNIGLDSIIFIDDSPFECAEVSGRIPDVETVIVPKKISSYPQILNDISQKFSKSSDVDTSKTKQYKIRAQAEKDRSKFASHEDFLKSLQMKVIVTKNKKNEAPRIAELSQKTNQFNLTTDRYSVSNIESAMEAENQTVYSLKLTDKFGNHGITGVALIDYNQNNANISSFFLSCRILGRDVEIAFWNKILSDIKDINCKTVTAEYIATSKNSQVNDFYDRLGFERLGDLNGKSQKYESKCSNIQTQEKPWLEIIDGE